MFYKLLQVLLILTLLTLPMSATSSESIICNGFFESWHDGKVSDRSMAYGNIEYGAEVYNGGLSSGLTVKNGKGSYNFVASDYSVQLKEFNGTIVSESDSVGTVVTGNGTGQLKIRSYGSYNSMVRPFPIGGITANGYFNISSRTTKPITAKNMSVTDETTEMLRGLI
mgnify:CR=1 FL=1